MTRMLRDLQSASLNFLFVCLSEPNPWSRYCPRTEGCYNNGVRTPLPGALELKVNTIVGHGSSQR